MGKAGNSSGGKAGIEGRKHNADAAAAAQAKRALVLKLREERRAKEAKKVEREQKKANAIAGKEKAKKSKKGAPPAPRLTRLARLSRRVAREAQRAECWGREPEPRAMHGGGTAWHTGRSNEQAQLAPSRLDRAAFTVFPAPRSAVPHKQDPVRRASNSQWYGAAWTSQPSLRTSTHTHAAVRV